MAEDKLFLNLKVLSPSTEVKGVIGFSDLPAATTIKELRARIQSEIESKPSLDRMRLIYRGRVVANDTDNLIDVFGLDNIRISKDQSLHLVLKELHSPAVAAGTTATTSTATSPAPRSSTAPPNPFRPVQTPPQGSPGPTNPFRALQQPVRPNSQPQAHPHPHHHHHHHHAQQLPHTQFAVPGGLPSLFQQQLGQAMAQNQPLPTLPGQATQTAQSRSGTPTSGAGTPGSTPGPIPTVGGGATNPPGNTTRIIRHETIGPNGERWTYTVNNTSITIPAQGLAQPLLPRPFPHPPGFQLPARGGPTDSVDQVLARVGAELQNSRQEMDNVRLLLQRSGSLGAPSASNPSLFPPVWPVDRLRLHVQNITQSLDNLQHRLAALLAIPSMTQNRELASMQQTATDLRAQADELNATLDRMQTGPNPNAGSPNGPPSGSRPSSSTAQQQPDITQEQPQQSTSTPTHPSRDPELFILSSPQGPVGILFDQRGTYTTAPMVPTLPFQTFTQQFSSNRQVLAGLGQHIAQNTAQLQNHIVATQPQNQPTTGTTTAADQAQAAQPNANQNVNQENQPQPQNPVQPQPPAPEQDRVMVIFGHFWLIVKLAFFIYFFAGGGGWYRPFMIGTIAAVVYLANLGIFEGQFDGIRRHFEALLPIADRPAAQPGNNRNVPTGQPHRDPTPEEAAQRLVQADQERRFGWVRDTFRTMERAFALFVASLWPGIGERMVQAQEERERAERAAAAAAQEEERARLEREREQGQEGEKPATESETVKTENVDEKVDASVGPSSSKGKEKVDVADESSPSSSASSSSSSSS